MHMKYIFLTGLFFLCLALLPAPPVRVAEAVETGTCGETAQWFMYNDGTMVIRGDRGDRHLRAIGAGK